MNADERAQIQLVLDYEFGRALERANKVANEIFAKRSVTGTVRSGSAISEILARQRDELGNLIDDVMLKVGAISRERRAAALVTVAFTEFMDKLLNGEFKHVAAIVSGDGSRDPNDGIWSQTKTAFHELNRDLDTRLRIASYDFNARPNSQDQPAPKAKSSAQRKNPGGKPLARHWDALWAEIAVQLWNGDLKPTKQADISKAMHDWLAAKNLDAGNTAVTDRARALWQRIEREI